MQKNVIQLKVTVTETKSSVFVSCIKIIVVLSYHISLAGIDSLYLWWEKKHQQPALLLYQISELDDPTLGNSNIGIGKKHRLTNLSQKNVIHSPVYC